MNHRRQRARVVVAGGGVAALETVLALHSLAGHVLDVTLVAPEREFLYRPVTVAEAFDRGEARSFSIMELVGNLGGVRVVWDSVAEVIPDEHVALTAAGQRISFDALVVATGALTREPVPGALTFRGRADVAALRHLLEELVDGSAASVVFAVPSERMWPLPLYELALMTAGYLNERNVNAVRLMLVTPEEEPLELFGPEAAHAIAPLLSARGIELRCSSLPAALDKRALVLAGGARIYTNRVITLPLAEGSRMPGLPCDQHGFIPVDEHGRVASVEDVFAAGDVTSFPLKQGGLAAQQADAVAEAIAAGAGAAVVPAPFSPVLRGLLLTGGAPLYLRSEPQHLPSRATVAIDATRTHLSRRPASAAAGQALWWPPAKIAGRYLAAHLATAQARPLSSEVLADRTAVFGRPPSAAEQDEAVDLALMLAECDARWGDFDSALNALDAAEALQGALPADYQAKRRAWSASRRIGD